VGTHAREDAIMNVTAQPTDQQPAYTPHEHEELHSAAQSWRDSRPDPAADTRRSSIFAERRAKQG